MDTHRNPIPTVDIIIEMKKPAGGTGIILIRRKNPPYGWALPGGFVDYGESLEEAASREAGEETGLEIRHLEQMHTYSDPERDPRKHTISTVFTARGYGEPKAMDDAAEIGIFSEKEITFPLAFDHRKIVNDYFQRKKRSPRQPEDGTPNR